MEQEQAVAEEGKRPFNRKSRRSKATLYEKIRTLGYIFWLPLGGGLLIAAWYFVPIWQANYEQTQLADAFFAQCQKAFEETSQVPPIPEEALRAAERERKLTYTALRTWAPKVTGEIRDGYWFARIEFQQPSSTVVEKKIGVAVNEGAFEVPKDGSSEPAQG